MKRQERGGTHLDRGRPDLAARVAVGKPPPPLKQILKLVPDHELNAELARAQAAYERGEYPSVRAAAEASGIIKEPTPLEQIQALLPKLSAAEREELIRELLVSQ